MITIEIGMRLVICNVHVMLNSLAMKFCISYLLLRNKLPQNILAKSNGLHVLAIKAYLLDHC